MPGTPSTGARIRRARKLLRLTQQELAVKGGASRTAVDSWENDRAYPKRYDVVLEEVLGITLGETSAPAAELTATDEWEQSVLDDPNLSGEDKRFFIERSRDARRQYVAARRERRAAEPEAARSDPGREAG